MGCYFKYQVHIQATDIIVYITWSTRRKDVSEETIHDLMQDLHTLWNMQWMHTGAFFLTLRCQAVSVSLES
jgi:hypothetical protein